MADHHPLVLDEKEAFRFLIGAVVAVAGNLFQGDVGEAAAEALRVRPAVSQVEDHPGLLFFNRLHHMVKIPVGIGEDENFHGCLLFGKLLPVYDIFSPMATTYDPGAREDAAYFFCRLLQQKGSCDKMDTRTEWNPDKEENGNVTTKRSGMQVGGRI